jgi:hypothetical protein
MSCISWEDEKDLRYAEMNRFCISRVRAYRKLGDFPEQFPTQIEWILKQPEAVRYFASGPRVKDDGYEPNNPGGSSLTRPWDIVVHMLVDAGRFLNAEHDGIQATFKRMRYTDAYSDLIAPLQGTLWIAYRHSLEDGPRILFPDTFVAERFGVEYGYAVKPPQAGRWVNKLVGLRFLLLAEPGHATALPWLRQSRQVRLNPDYGCR